MKKKILLFLLIFILIIGGGYYFLSGFSFALMKNYDTNYGDDQEEILEITSKILFIYASIECMKDNDEDLFNKDFSFLPWGKIVPFYRNGSWNYKIRNYKFKLDSKVFERFKYLYADNFPNKYKFNDTVTVSGKIYPKDTMVDSNIDGVRIKINADFQKKFISINDNIYDNQTLLYKFISSM